MASDRFRVYISGPYSSAPEANTKAAINWMNALLDAGLAPFCPHLSHYPHTVEPRDYEEWLAYDLTWLEPCDVLLRLPGYSPGADREVATAIEYDIPVVYAGELDRLAVLDLLKAAVTPAPELTPEPPGSCLDEAKSIVYGDRHHDYGHPGDNHATTAAMFRAYLKRRYCVDLDLDGRAICQFNILQKVSRDAHCPKRDNLVDMQGYAENAQMCTDHVPAETPHFTG